MSILRLGPEPLLANSFLSYDPESCGSEANTTGALIIRTGFWGPLYHSYSKEPPKIVLVIISAPILEVIKDATSKCLEAHCSQRSVLTPAQCFA